MKVIENVTLYKCDHCGKKLQRKHAMEAHEKKCSSNPENDRMCSSCIFLEKVNISYEPHVQSYEGTLNSSICFKCTKKDIFMFPVSFEYSNKGVPPYVEYQGEEIIQQPMLKECDIYSHWILDVEQELELFTNKLYEKP